MKYEKSCGCVVIKDMNYKKKILLVRQIDGNWYLPKGHVEKNETEKETAIREVKEETGVDVKIVTDFRKVITYMVGEDISKDVVFFIAKYIGGNDKKQEEEILEIKWCTYEEAKEMLTYKQNVEVLKEAKKIIESI